MSFDREHVVLCLLKRGGLHKSRIKTRSDSLFKPKEVITSPRLLRLLLIYWVSFKRSLVVAESDKRSEPARSMRLMIPSLLSLVFSLTPASLSVKTLKANLSSIDCPKMGMIIYSPVAARRPFVGPSLSYRTIFKGPAEELVNAFFV